MKSSRKYLTGYLAEDWADWPLPPFKGRGWYFSYSKPRKHQVEHRAQPKASARRGHSWPKEITINAPKYQTAQEAFDLLSAAIVVRRGGDVLFEIDGYPQPVDTKELIKLFGRGPFEEFHFGRFVDTLDFPPDCMLAAKASHRRAYKYALQKLKFSYGLISYHFVDMDPSTATDHFGTSPYSSSHVRLAYSIVSAYSAIEEIGLEIRASASKPSLLPDGSWNPKVRSDLEKRLRGAKINIDDSFPWIRRGKPTKVEKAKELPSKGRCSWSRGHYVRDCELELIDAIRIGSFIRSKITAHRLPEVAASLTIYDLENVRNLARRLLLERLGLWRVEPIGGLTVGG
jgi:hypothetical protein